MELNFIRNTENSYDMKGKISLRVRIFFSMILLTIFSLLLIVVATYFQYFAQNDDYNNRRLIRKETQVKSHLKNIIIKDTAIKFVPKNYDYFLKEFNPISAIHKVEFALYSLDGKPLYYSYVDDFDETDHLKINDTIIKDLTKNQTTRILEQNINEKGKFQSSYSLLLGDDLKPYLILYFPYFEDLSFSQTELNIFLIRLLQVYSLMLIATIFFAFFLSSFITRPIEKLRSKILKTGLLEKNNRIKIKTKTKEIESLVRSYNKMLSELEKSAEKLARGQREQAWQEMAKQVAHEIKNPLTPMRLTIQSFQQFNNPNEKNYQKKLESFLKTLIEQIDTMSMVANTFSDFATMPKPKIKDQDIVEITKSAVQIFKNANLKIKTTKKKIIWPIDRTQWIRVLTNLIQNAIQAVPENRTPKINLEILLEKNKLKMNLEDNGTGIVKRDQLKIFEPKFTTKSAGMGLGLAIVKNIIDSLNGTINFKSEPNKGTKFSITLKK